VHPLVTSPGEGKRSTGGSRFDESTHKRQGTVSPDLAWTISVRKPENDAIDAKQLSIVTNDVFSHQLRGAVVTGRAYRIIFVDWLIVWMTLADTRWRIDTLAAGDDYPTNLCSLRCLHHRDGAIHIYRCA